MLITLIAIGVVVLGIAYWITGDLEAGHRAWAECVAGLYRAGHVADTFGCSLGLADIRRGSKGAGSHGLLYDRGLEEEVTGCR